MLVLTEKESKSVKVTKKFIKKTKSPPKLSRLGFLIKITAKYK